MSCGVGHRCGSDPELLWLWRRPVATALIRPLAWESPYVALNIQKDQKKKSVKREAAMEEAGAKETLNGFVAFKASDLWDNMASKPPKLIHWTRHLSRMQWGRRAKVENREGASG